MAKRKTSQNPSNQDISNEKISRLKSLNTLLLKEVSDRRLEVDSLMEAKGSLEKLLIETTSDKDEILLELAKMEEESLRLEFEWSVMVDYVCSHAREFCEVVMKERDVFSEFVMKERDDFFKSVIKEREDFSNGVNKEKDEFFKLVMKQREDFEVVEKAKRKVLEEEIEELMREKALNQKSIEEKERKISCIEKEKELVEEEMSLEKANSVEMERGREEIRIQLQMKVNQNQELSGNLVKMEARLNAVKEEFDCVVKENEEVKKEIELLRREKEEIEMVVGLVEKEKEGVEVELSLEKAKKIEREKSLSRLSEILLKLGRVHEGLRMDMIELENKCVEVEEKEKAMAVEINRLVGENKEMVKGVERVVEEKGLVERKLDEALKRVNDQKKEMVDNDESLWKYISYATSIVATISIAYIARGLARGR